MENPTVPLKIIKALADRSRLQIVNLLLEKSQYLEVIAEQLDLAPSTASFHLKKLTDAGLVRKEKNQYYSEFHLNHSILSQRLVDIIRQADVVIDQHDRLDAYERKILAPFWQNGKLLRLPKQLKKRQLVLKQLAQQFKTNTVYKEAEVNTILGAFHDDYCLLRRDLVDFGYLRRKKGQYWVNLTTEEKMQRQKELKRAYLKTARKGGIFQIRNLKNQKRLLGSSFDIEKAFNRHVAMLKFGSHCNQALQADFNKMGLESFSMDVLDELDTAEKTETQITADLEELLQLWREKLALPRNLFYT